MRLGELKEKLANALLMTSWEFIPDNTPGSSYYNIKGIYYIRLFLNTLDGINAFEEELKILKDFSFLKGEESEARILRDNAKPAKELLDSLKVKVRDLFEILNQSIPAEREDQINIKLPPVVDFQDLSKVANDLNQAITTIIIQEEISGETKIVSAENGSIWIGVAIGITAIPIVSSLIWASVVIANKVIELGKASAQLRALNIENDVNEAISTAVKENVKNLIEVEAKHIQSEFFDINNPENITRIENSIEKLSNLIQRGAEFHPSLNAPKEIRELFPTPSSSIGIESKAVKMIENKGEK